MMDFIGLVLKVDKTHLKLDKISSKNDYSNFKVLLATQCTGFVIEKERSTIQDQAWLSTKNHHWKNGMKPHANPPYFNGENIGLVASYKLLEQ